MKDTMIGVDLAKRVFQVHEASMRGEAQFRRKLTREEFLAFMEHQAPAVVVFEACGGASYWAREMVALGHDVRLIAPQYVRTFVKRQKNDAADAEAIVDAAQRPEMRFVTPKTADQQARAVLFRGRKRLVHQRTELVDALRATLYEYGHTVPQGFGHIKRIEVILDAPDNNLPVLVREECRDLLVQIAEKTARIDARTRKIKLWRSKPIPRAACRPCQVSARRHRWRLKHSRRRWRISAGAGTSRPGSASCRASIRRVARSGLAGSPRPAKPTSGDC